MDHYIHKTLDLKMSLQTRPNCKALTGIRFFAALHVILYHYASLPFSLLPTSVRNVAKHGYLGVSLFFVLSGFILAYTYCGREPKEKTIDARPFWVARFARIYPMYFFALLLSLPLIFDAASKLSPASPLTFLAVLLNFFLLQSWTPFSIAHQINTPGWSLSTEVFFYLLFPFIISRISNLSTKQIYLGMCLCWLSSLLAPLAYQKFAIKLFQGSWISWGDFVAYFPPFHLPQFILGILAGMLFLRKLEVSNYSKHSRSFVPAVIASVLLIFFMAYHANSEASAVLNNGFMAPVFALIIYALAHGTGSIAEFLSLPYLIVLGEASYGLYILQAPVRSWMNLLNADTGSLNYLSGYILAVVCLTICTFYLWETPMRKFLRSKLVTISN
jgi:peptidoglycan/LPS O-acetylase OafA/YrhL